MADKQTGRAQVFMPTIKITRKDGTVEYHTPKGVKIINKEKWDEFQEKLRQEQIKKEQNNG